MKKFLLITTALVALGAAPVFAQTSATVKTTPSAAKATPEKAVKKVSASKAKGHKAMIHHASAKHPVMGSKKSLNAKEKTITAQLNKEAQASAGAVAAQPMQGQQMGSTSPASPSLTGLSTRGSRPATAANPATPKKN